MNDPSYSSLYALHGFLGLPSDWNFLDINNVNCIDLWKKPITPYEQWAFDFNSSVEQPSILLGYSLGGRLALHALRQQPKKWKAAIFISTHPGLLSDTEKQDRLANDNEWARLFHSVPWQNLMQLWNQQKTFHNTHTPPRSEEDFSRQVLASSLTTWSLGKQDNFYKDLSNFDHPILWITGAKDLGFTQLAKNATLRHDLSRMCVLPQAGHRLIWDQPKLLNHEINLFLASIKGEYGNESLENR